MNVDDRQAGSLAALGETRLEPCCESPNGEMGSAVPEVRSKPKVSHSRTHYDPVTDRWLDGYLGFSEDNQSRLALELVPKILAKRNTKRDLSAKERARLCSVACMIVANALKAKTEATSKVCYSRKYSTYSDESLRFYHYPAFVGAKTLIGVVDAMVLCGWLTTELGFPGTEDRQGKSSTLGATDELVHYCAAIGINHHQTRRRRDAPVLILKDEAKKPIPYCRDQHQGEERRLWAYNDFIAKQRLQLQVSERELVEYNGRLAKGGKGSLSLQATSLYRVFNNSDWRQDGRFYGGWWQRIPSRWRQHITINDGPTIELDYSGFGPRALYHSEGLTFPNDPYAVPAIRERAPRGGKDEEAVREYVKGLAYQLIYSGPGSQLSPDADLVAAFHKPIAHKFRQGEGLRIMYRESKICDRILTVAVRQGIPILPIHDSYIVQERHREWLWKQMALSYRREFPSFDPVIKEKDKNGIGSPPETQPIADMPPALCRPPIANHIGETTTATASVMPDRLVPKPGMRPLIPQQPAQASGRLVQGNSLLQAILDLVGKSKAQ